jgi:hapalindole biogenesis HpiC1 cyclase-like protein/PEP-CTERM motif-containing protein
MGVKVRVFAAVFATSLLFAGAASATPITVSNPSFEILVGGGSALPLACAGAGCTYSNGPGAIPGWINVAASGAFQPGPASNGYFNFLPHGPTTAYSNEATSPISQIVGTAVAGVTYTLLVDVGIRNDVFVSTPGLAQLTIGGVPVATGLGLAPAAGDWSTFTATYLATPADNGMALGILLFNPGIAGSQGNFDNVRLSDDTIGPAVVPEPATLLLLGIGLAGARAARYRMRRG